MVDDGSRPPRAPGSGASSPAADRAAPRTGSAADPRRRSGGDAAVPERSWEVWIREDEPGPRSTAGRRNDDVAPAVDLAAVTPALVDGLGERRGSRAARQVKEAARAFGREQYGEARRILAPIARDVPRAIAVRELLGLTYYRQGRWKEAVRELEAFRNATGEVDQNHVLADCYRALRRYQDAEERWDELRIASPGGELVTEGRIVAAGALADQGRLQDAIRLLETAATRVKKLRPHHLRQAYALADLYERAGDLPRARELFGWVADRDPGLGDAAGRVANLA